MPRRTWIKWISGTGGVTTLLLLLLDLAFYSGASLGSHVHWRLEHGRLTVKATSIAFRESFYVAINSEELRWRPEGQFSSWQDWTITIPLWAAAVVFSSIFLSATGQPSAGHAHVGSTSQGCRSGTGRKPLE